MLLDTVSTSDADERELLEAANSTSYWERVVPGSHPVLSDPQVSDMEGIMADSDSLVYRRPTVTHPTSHALSSSPATLGSLSRTVSEIFTTPGCTDLRPPTSPPASPLPATSPSTSLLLHHPQTPRRRSIENRSVSLDDPLQLSSSAARHCIVRPHADEHSSFAPDAVAELRTTSSPMQLIQRLDAVLGRSSSSNLPHAREFSPQPINARQRSPTLDPFTVPASTTAGTNQDRTSTLDNGDSAAGGRYSMRTRQPRQLKPYAFDRLEYKHQLKHHPDAIVKFAGHLNAAESSSSGSSESGNDGAAENSGGEPVQRPPHTKGKKRQRSNTERRPVAPHSAHRRTSVAGPSARSPSLDRRSTGSPAVEDLHRVESIPDLDRNDSPELPTTWYPGVFNDSSSGLDSDDVLLSTVRDPPRDCDTPLPRVKRKRRAPRQLPNLSPLASPPLPLSGTPSPRSKPASLRTISSDSRAEESSTESESTRSPDDFALLSEESAIMHVDGPSHTPSPSPEPERSSPKPSHGRRLRPSRHLVITDFFDRRPREKKKRSRKRGIVAPERAGRTTHASERVGGSGPQPGDRRKSKSHTRRRRDRPQRPADLSVFTIAGGRVLSGWQRRNAVTIDTEDVAFKRALEPLAPRSRPPPPIRPPSGLHSVRHPLRETLRSSNVPVGASSKSKIVDAIPDNGVRHRIVVDFDIPFLSSGKVFAASSYLGRGWLYELLSITSGTPLSHSPPAFEVDGHILSSTSTALDFTVFLPYACDRFAKVLSDPLMMSHEAFTNWNANMHAVCSLVSWISASAASDDAHLIRTASLEYTGSLIARIDTALGDSRDQAKSLTSSILYLHWFAVELLVRACWGPAGSDKDFATAISARLVGLVNRLLQIGVQPVISHVVANHEPLDDLSLYSCGAELWICLVHLWTVDGRATGALGETNPLSLADILQQSLSATESHAHGGLHASEEIWCTLFGLCALSQFSAHGVSTSTARMNTSWELVLFALDFIRLIAYPQIDSGLSSRNLRRRDAYIRLVVSRCFILHQRWRWRLDNDASATLFRRLVEIFKSRKFADLRGEIAGFSAFVQENDARLLAAHASTDSAFTIFLKLIFASAEQMRTAMREDEYLGRTKKLLSLVTPVGSVQLSALRSPFDEQLSMLYNRFSSLALAVRVLPSAESMHYRVSLARRYVDFGPSAAATRSVCIRAANFLALQALNMVLPVGAALEWTSEIAQTLISEFRAAVAAPSATEDARRRKSESVQCTQLLLSGLHDMSRATASAEKDPSTALQVLQTGCLFPILAEAELCAVPTIQALVQGIVEVHLNYALSLQRGEEPQEPPQPRAHQEESQDEYGEFYLNWDDPIVLAALDNASAAEPTPVTVPAPAVTMQYTHQSIVERIRGVTSPTLFQHIIPGGASENQRQQQ